MKRISVIIVAVVLAGCGSTKHHLNATDQKAAQADTVKIEAQARHCVPDPFVLKTKAGRTKAANCLAPAKNRHALVQCLFRGGLSGLPTKTRLHNVLITCTGRYA